MRNTGRRAISASACASALLVWSSASAQPSLTTRNSVAVPLLQSGSLQIAGIGCGVSTTGELPIPSDALNARVRKPAPGTTGFSARVTDVALQGAVVRVTAVGEGDATCDPAYDSVPPASRPWSERFPSDVSFARRETVAVVAHWRRHGGLVVRPSRVALRSYTQDATDTVRNIRWTRYGGPKAVGFGIFKAAPFFCPSPTRCAVVDGKPVRVELTRPSYCAGGNVRAPGERPTPVAFYGRVSAVAIRQTGSYKPGTSFQSYRPFESACLGPGLPIR